MQLETETHNGVLIITALMKRIDAAVAIQFKDNMREATKEPLPRIVLDLSEVDFMDSSGLGAVVAAMKLLAPDHKLELAGLTANVEKVFRLTRMDSVFTIHADKDTALNKNAHVT